MRIGIVGVGNIGRNCAVQALRAGHRVMLSYSRDPQRLRDLADELGAAATADALADTVAGSDVVVLSVPWGRVDDVVATAGSFAGRIVIDTTNQFAAGGVVDLGSVTAARHNADRLVGARYTKSFNTLTSAFQAATAGRSGDDRVVQWVSGDDLDAVDTVSALIDSMGYAPVYLGGIDGCSVMEAPRRPGAVYGEEYHVADALAVVDAVRNGRPIPPTPSY
jgi:predicted dinucleotide-binding enzyme